jgi:hypothetical protein
MAVTVWAAAVLAGIAVTACGDTSSTHQQPRRLPVRVDGRISSDNVRMTAAHGTGFLVPASALAAQRSAHFHVASPPPGNPNQPVQVGPSSPADVLMEARFPADKWLIRGSVTGTTPEAAHVELLVTGPPGQGIYLSFEESCGFVPSGSGGAGTTALRSANGQRFMRTPAVLRVPALNSRANNRCYVAGTVVGLPQAHLHLSLIDY